MLLIVVAAAGAAAVVISAVVALVGLVAAIMVVLVALIAALIFGVLAFAYLFLTPVGLVAFVCGRLGQPSNRQRRPRCLKSTCCLVLVISWCCNSMAFPWLMSFDYGPQGERPAQILLLILFLTQLLLTGALVCLLVSGRWVAEPKLDAMRWSRQTGRLCPL